MGCGSSKIDGSPLMSLCRERRDLIRDAADFRYELATAHARYLRSLDGVSYAIRNFAVEELAAFPSLSPPSSPVIELPSNSKSGGSLTPLSHSLSESESEESLKSSPEIRVAEPLKSPNSNFYFMRSSPAIPTMIYQNPYALDDDYPYDHSIGSQMRDRTAEVSPPPPPPPPAGSAWDFFDPFNSYENFLPNYGSSSTNSSGIREREGIPGLEDENELESLKISRKKEKEPIGDSKRNYSGEGTSRSMPIDEEIESIELKKEKSTDKEVILEEESSMTTEESVSSNANVVPAPIEMRDLMEVVKEIKGLFKSAIGCGEEVSRMLEVGKVNYRAMNRIFRVVSSRILEPTGFSTLKSSWPFKHSKKYRAKTVVSVNRIGMKSGNMSSTLEKLYVWEKKLYKEVKGEEKLRAVYQKKCRTLRYLDRRGAVFHKIDSTRASIRRLETKLSIVIKSVDAISGRMHKIRDDELQPQLIELIKGLMRMWKSMLECQQKQFQAIFNCKSHNLASKTRVDGKLVSSVTRELEFRLISWCSNFHEWISIQKSYVEALDGWLMRWLSEDEQEETSDGFMPFSPSCIEAPTVFIVSNDWNNALRRVPEAEVMQTMHSFAVNVQRLGQSQEEEERQKLKTGFLSKEYAKRLNSLQNHNGVHGNLDVVSVTDDGQVKRDNHLMTALAVLRKRLDEERSKHDEIVKRVHDVASNSLKTGLLPIFEALEDFCLETIRAYEGIRVPNEVEGP